MTTLSAPTLRRAEPRDRAGVLELLRSQGLPTEGLAFVNDLFVMTDAGEAVGCAALETHGSAGLLRSLAVTSARRGAGLGGRLVEAVLEAAKAHHLTTLSLLTTTAESYFPRFGFRRVGRSQLPADLGASAELRGACPASAVAMKLELSGPR
jgi:amino-acid N-acetyltransferase